MTAMDVLHKLFSEEFEAERQRGFNEGYAEVHKSVIQKLIEIGWSPEQAADFVNNNN